MRIVSFLFLAAFFFGGSGGVAAQKQDVLKGTLSVAGEAFTYELHFTETTSGAFTGYALTYIKKEKDSRAPISGRIDRARKTITFAEESIDYNHGFESQAVICLIRAELRYQPGVSNGRPGLTGSTISSDYALASCAQGSLSFIADSSLTGLFARADIAPPPTATATLLHRVTAQPAATGALPAVAAARSASGAAVTAVARPAAPKAAQPPPPPTPGQQAQPKPQPVATPVIAAAPKPGAGPGQNPAAQKVTPRRVVTAPPKAEPPPAILFTKPTPPPAPKPAGDTAKQITAGTNVAYDWDSDTLRIDVWDGGRVDGDQINLVYNNQLVLARYTLTAGRKTVSLPVPPGETALRILAVYEGSELPNTANLMLHDGPRQYAITANNSVGNVSVIKIRKKPRP